MFEIGQDRILVIVDAAHMRVEVGLDDLNIVVLRKRDHALKPIFVDEIVRLHDGDVFALRKLKPLVHRVAIA